MYSSFQLAQKYFRYYVKAANGKGHGVHSPFVFDFIKHVLNDRTDYEVYAPIEKLRKELLQDDLIIEVEDFGAGSAVMPFKKRKISDIARTSLKNKKYAQLLYRIAKYYRPENIIELGTSLGVTTGYFASAIKGKVFTFEGSSAVAAVAQKVFDKQDLKNVKLTEGNFDDTLPLLLNEMPPVSMAYIDGNHRKEPTLRYFNWLLEKVNDHTILIFDDIHWSREMEEAWEEIKTHEAVTLSIDLFFIGLVFFRKDFRVKQDFAVRF